MRPLPFAVDNEDEHEHEHEHGLPAYAYLDTTKVMHGHGRELRTATERAERAKISPREEIGDGCYRWLDIALEKLQERRYGRTVRRHVDLHPVLFLCECEQRALQQLQHRRQREMLSSSSVVSHGAVASWNILQLEMMDRDSRCVYPFCQDQRSAHPFFSQSSARLASLQDLLDTRRSATSPTTDRIVHHSESENSRMREKDDHSSKRCRAGKTPPVGTGAGKYCAGAARAKAILTLLLCIWRLAIVAGLPTRPLLRIVLAEHHGVMFCYECIDPLREGSYLSLLSSFVSARGYFIAADLVYGVPNKGETALNNEDEVRGRILLLDRGKVSFARKARHAQLAGANGVIIVDNKSCQDRSSKCFDAQSYSPAVASVAADGTASGFSTPLQIQSRDSATAWIGIQIPSVLISADDGDRLRSLMTLSTFELHGELQYINED